MNDDDSLMVHIDVKRERVCVCCNCDIIREVEHGCILFVLVVKLYLTGNISLRLAISAPGSILRRITTSQTVTSQTVTSQIVTWQFIMFNAAEVSPELYF